MCDGKEECICEEEAAVFVNDEDEEGQVYIGEDGEAFVIVKDQESVGEGKCADLRGEDSYLYYGCLLLRMNCH